jgi:hypothetical protein
LGLETVTGAKILATISRAMMITEGSPDIEGLLEA